MLTFLAILLRRLRAKANDRIARTKHRFFGPTYARAYGPAWDAARWQRQHRPFVVDRSELFHHGVDQSAQ